MRTIRTPVKKAKVLEVISAGRTASEAATAAGIGRTALWQWRQDDPLFNAEFERAFEAGTEVWEQEARRRAFDQSDALLIFMLKSRDPKRFNQKTIAIGGDPGAPPIAIPRSGGSNNVRIYLPANFRDRPERDESLTTIATPEGEEVA